MQSADIERRVADYYTGKLREHGATHSGVDWNSSESQLLRFEQFMRIIPRDEHVSVLDYGCGYGALAPYLEASGVDFEYTGYDLSDEMVARGRELAAGRPQWSFTTERDELGRADFTLASGVFNVRVGTDEERWREYTLETIGELAALSRRGLGFNMLTSYSDPERMTERLYYADPGFYFDWCKRNVSRHVALLDDYGLYEFTIVVRLDA
jgi:SAM-dependent methyltransferase